MHVQCTMHPRPHKLHSLSHCVHSCSIMPTPRPVQCTPGRAVHSDQMRSGVVPMGLTSSMGLLRMKSAQCLGIRLARVTASLLSSSATWDSQVAGQQSECAAW